MIRALHRYPRKERRAVAQEWARRSHAAQAAKRLTLGVDAETLRRRAMDDARGQLLREGRTYSATAITHWQIVRSVKGRTDQRDILINGEVFRTFGRRRLPAWLR